MGRGKYCHNGIYKEDGCKSWYSLSQHWELSWYFVLIFWVLFFSDNISGYKIERLKKEKRTTRFQQSSKGITNVLKEIGKKV